MLRVAEHYAVSDTGLQRRANEDSLLARAPLFVVADGMGGAQAGEVASRIAVESFEQGLDEASEPELGLATLALNANTRIHELSQSNAEQAGMGTTLTAVYIGEDEVTIAHVGDSRAYCLRDGELVRLTDDHSLVDELIRQGRLTPEEAVEHPQRSVITRALGPEAVVEVDTRSFRARDGDLYLLCSDGLTTMVPEELLRSILVTGGSLREIGEALIAAANEAGGRDNITVVLVRLEEVGAGGAATATSTPTLVADGTPPPPGPLTQSSPGPLTQSSPGPLTQSSPHPAASSSPEIAPSPAPGDSAPSARAGDPGGVLGTPAGASLLTTESERVPAAVRRRVPRRRPAGANGASPAAHRRRRRLRRASAVAVLLVTLGLIFSAAYLAIQSIYFIGTNSRGLVTIYNGLPYRLPGGIALYTTTYVSGVAASTLTPERRHSLLDHSLRSESQAGSLVRSLELGQLE